jgi:hypothetical protein
MAGVKEEFIFLPTRLQKKGIGFGKKIQLLIQTQYILENRYGATKHVFNVRMFILTVFAFITPIKPVSICQSHTKGHKDVKDGGSVEVLRTISDPKELMQ